MSTTRWSSVVEVLEGNEVVWTGKLFDFADANRDDYDVYESCVLMVERNSKSCAFNLGAGGASSVRVKGVQL